MSPPQEVWGLLFAGRGGSAWGAKNGGQAWGQGGGEEAVGWGGGVELAGCWGRHAGPGGAECQGWELEETARSGAGTFSPELQHLPLMKHFITAALQGGHPIRDDKFPATALRSLAAAVILLHLE